MIRLPNLDDQRYEDIVEAAKRRIPVIYPEWTDFNEHDPGITMIELFAWLKEMQQYYLNRISDRSYENMLGLLGIDIAQAQPATVEMRFADAPASLIRGAEAATEDGTVFVSEQAFSRAPVALTRMFVENADEIHDVTDIAADRTTDFYPFGARHGASERRLYIGLTVTDPEAFARDGAELFFDIPDKCPVARNPAGEDTRLPRRLRWEYSTADGFCECTSVTDGTLALSFSGGVRLTAGEDFTPNACGGRLPKELYFRVGVIDDGCEDMPALSAVYTDRLILRQMRRESDFTDIVWDGHSPVTVSDKLLCEGLSYVLIRDADGWRYAENAATVEHGERVDIDLSDCGCTPSTDGKPNVRVIYCREHFGRSKMFFTADGLPAQRFAFDPADEVLTDALCVMVAESDGRGGTIWNEFAYVDSLALAGPYDRCFTYDREARMLVFGDNENGESPRRGEDCIMVTRCACTKGAAGNVRRGNLRTLTGVGTRCEAIQATDAEGGRGRETLRHAMDRLKARLGDCVRAVTAEDYRTLALGTPGLRIADVKAIPFFDPDIPAASRDKLVNTITLAVLPYSPEAYPMPDESFLAAVREHIEQVRMITTHIKVVAPIYVSADISAQIICTTREVEQVKRRAAKTIRNMYSLYRASGASFGEPISDVAIMTELSGLDGILSVKRLQVRVEDSRCYRDKYGRIIIPPHAIACCGNIDIEVIEP